MNVLEENSDNVVWYKVCLHHSLLENFVLTYIKERFLSDEEIIEHLFVRTKIRSAYVHS